MTAAIALPTLPFPVLLVEDDTNDVLLIQRAFRQAGLSAPLRVADGEEAVAYLGCGEPYADRARHPRPALVLLDLKLPRRGGLEVLEWLRAQPAAVSRVPVVVLTSSKESGDIERAYELGANSYLVKPVRFDALLDMVKSLGSYWAVHNQTPPIDYGPGTGA